ncbi:MAG: T9SS type A sorting domain-containing protein [Bacteroidetes bacterium]|nr:T9SS type A sorting domain-containing protein [Bacteroidota bacterium]
MRRNSTNKISCILLIACAVSIRFAFAQQKIDTVVFPKPKAKTSYFKNSLHLSMPPLKPAVTSSQKINVLNDKLLEDVQVFPNPITDQVSVKYQLSHSAVVTVKVMDVLGNDVITLVQARVESGEQNFSYPLANKLQRGFYFIRVVAGNESVIKRISVL